MSKTIELVKSQVVFNELDHTYMFNGKQLSGVTSMLSRTLFRGKYKGISKEVLAKAADYGHNIHEQIELVDTLGVTSDTPAVQDYIRIKKEYGLMPIANEYLISDEETIASSIDIVYGVEGANEYVDITDVKTTSKLDMAYLSWQLSMYAHLFERQNPMLKVRRQLAIWLPKPKYGHSMCVEVPRKSKEAIEVLLAWNKSLTV